MLITESFQDIPTKADGNGSIRITCFFPMIWYSRPQHPFGGGVRSVDFNFLLSNRGVHFPPYDSEPPPSPFSGCCCLQWDLSRQELKFFWIFVGFFFWRARSYAFYISSTLSQKPLVMLIFFSSSDESEEVKNPLWLTVGPVGGVGCK